MKNNTIECKLRLIKFELIFFKFEFKLQMVKMVYYKTALRGIGDTIN